MPVKLNKARTGANVDKTDIRAPVVGVVAVGVGMSVVVSLSRLQVGKAGSLQQGQTEFKRSHGSRQLRGNRGGGEGVLRRVCSRCRYGESYLCIEATCGFT